MTRRLSRCVFPVKQLPEGPWIDCPSEIFGGIVRGWRGRGPQTGEAMHARGVTRFAFEGLVVSGLIALGACGSSGSSAASGSGEIPIVAAAGADVPYQFGANSYGVAGGAFLARANLGSSTVVLD